jgi:hypothetical protein
MFTSFGRYVEVLALGSHPSGIKNERIVEPALSYPMEVTGHVRIWIDALDMSIARHTPAIAAVVAVIVHESFIRHGIFFLKCLFVSGAIVDSIRLISIGIRYCGAMASEIK